MAFSLSLAHVCIASCVAALLISRQATQSFTGTLLQLLPAGFGIYTLYWSWIYPFYLSPLRFVPTVPGFPLWGQFRQIITQEVGVPQRDWHNKYGSIIRYFFPFGAERLSIADNDALKHMTVQNAYNYPKPIRAKLWMVRILGEGVLLAEGSEHVKQRKALNPGFSVQAIKALQPVFWEKGLHLSQLWKKETSLERGGTKALEVLEWLNRTTLDIIGQAAFGTDIDSLDKPETPLRQAYSMVFAFDLGSRLLHGLQAFFPASKLIPAKMNRDMQASRKIITKQATDIVQSKYDETDTKAKDIIALIVRQNEKAKESSEDLSFETMRDQVMTFLGAGHDTTATGIAWTLHLLSTHPEIQQRLRDEIQQHFPALFDAYSRGQGGEGFQDIDVDQLPYMNNVCRESLRFIPPIPMTVREAKADDNLGGYFVPKGTTVYILANAINRLPMYWGNDADNFDPDRWNNLPSTYTTNAYMTFLQGTRGCVGRKFAEIEMKIILCCLLSMFEFSPRQDIESPEDLKMWRLVLRPRDGISLNTKLIT